jgi:hypothetical protein
MPSTTEGVNVNHHPSSLSSVAVSSAAISFANFLLGHLRIAQARIDLASNELAAVATGLRAGWLDGDSAVAHLDSVGLLDFVVTERSS